MAENENDVSVEGVDAAAAPQAGVIAQYVKDLSFENPNAPENFSDENAQQPGIDVNVNVNGRKVSDEVYEVVLNVAVTAKKQDGNNVFVCELAYAGLFGLRNIPEEAMGPFMLVQAPTILFPFARRIIADATRDGGYPPLMLEPIDFMSLYQQQQQAGAEGQAAN